MFTFLYFFLSLEHLFASPVQVKNAFYCKTLRRNLPQVFPDVLCSLLGMSLLCLLSSPEFLFWFIPVVLCTWGGSILLHHLPEPRAARAMRGHGCNAVHCNGGPCSRAFGGGWRSPRAALALEVAGGTSVATEWPRLLLAALAGCSSLLPAGKLQRAPGAAVGLRCSV